MLPKTRQAINELARRVMSVMTVQEQHSNQLGRLIQMATREQMADDRYNELLGAVRDAFTSQRVEIETLKTALSNADQMAQERVDQALAADSEFDAERKEAGNSALAELLNAAPVESDEPDAEDPVLDEPTIPQPDENQV